MALVFEALEVIKAIRSEKEWVARVEKCDAKTQKHFTNVCAYID